MTGLHSNVASEPRRNGRAQQRATKRRDTIRVLAAVDGSERSNGVVDYLVTLAKSGGPIEVIVLNVQPLSESPAAWLWIVQAGRGAGPVDRPISESPSSMAWRDACKKAGIGATARVEIGEPVETILRCCCRANSAT